MTAGLDYCVAVVGGGHAGLEAAYAVARLGLSCVLLTLNKDKMGLMSCNPSVGGIGKGHLVKEVDALGGLIGLCTDLSAIQYRKLNTRKGPAVRATRAQCDRRLYAKNAQALVYSKPRIAVLEGEVVDILQEKGKVLGVVLRDGSHVRCKAVVLATGTFLGGLLHFGEHKEQGGRVGEPPSVGLTEALCRLGLRVGRLKTGTPPRLYGSSLDFDAMTLQPSEPDAGPFSMFFEGPHLPQLCCYVTHTTSETRRIIMENLDRAPLFTGQIRGRGPRYCPSIEDKVVRFAHHERHRVFMEPDGLDSDIVYPNGISTSLPGDVQEEFVRTIPGCENAELASPGYAVEYDFVDPTQLGQDLMTHAVKGLFLAGQIMGTTGYEEAAALGLMAGVNAALYVKGEPALVLDRAQGYIGVMIDDLVGKGVTEPYRMFTSRAEFRLALREDNAPERLSPVAERIGLLPATNLLRFRERSVRLKRALAVLETQTHGPCENEPITLKKWLRRPGVSLADILGAMDSAELSILTPMERQALESHVKLEGYLWHQELEVARFRKLEGLRIPEDLNFDRIPGLSIEVRERLKAGRPKTIGFASRLEGVTPGAIAAILLHLRQQSSAPSSTPRNSSIAD